VLVKTGARDCCVRPSLRPVAAAFIVFGSFAGAWAVAAIDIERAFDLSDAQLGFLLAAGIIAATAIAAIGGALVDRFGAGFALTRSLVIWGGLLAVEACAPHLGLFAPAFILAMAAGGAVDVVMNVISADALAAEPGKLVRFHGLFNGAAVVGAAVTGIALRFDVSWRVVWLAIAIAGIVIGAVCRRVPVPEPPQHTVPSMWRAVADLRHEGLIPLASVFSVAAMVEGGVATWGILYLRAHLGIGVLAGVSAYVIGESLATIARIGGGPLLGRIGSRRAITVGGALAAAGIATEALCANAALAATGLAAAAVGISVVWPLLIADVNNEAPHPAVAIGGVTACGYLGMVAGPPIVGVLSGAFSPRVGLLFLAAAALFVAFMPVRIRPRAVSEAR
jgi:MFS family permease